MGNKLSELNSIFGRNSRIQNFFRNRQLRIRKYHCHGIDYCSNRFSKEKRFCHCVKRRKISSQEFIRSKSIWPVPLVECLFLPEFKPQKSCKNCDFQVISFIANGAFGKVFKVVDRKSHKLYAMKILQKSRIIEENAVSQVKDEMRIQTICGHHQFLVNCLFSWQTHSELYFVSEYKSGGELLSIIERFSPMPENIVQIFVAELAIAIDFLHNAGIIHRDIKPENILLDENYHLSLTDFGLSKWLSIGSRTSTICGTPQYMGLACNWLRSPYFTIIVNLVAINGCAIKVYLLQNCVFIKSNFPITIPTILKSPEIKAMESYTHAVDWWSLGIVTCRLLTNEYPEIRDSKTILPEDDTMSIPSKDLLLRLLTVDGHRRLRSLYTLKTISFFKDFKFENISDRKVNPKELLFSHYRINENEIPPVFEDFDSAADNYSDSFYGTFV